MLLRDITNSSRCRRMPADNGWTWLSGRSFGSPCARRARVCLRLVKVNGCMASLQELCRLHSRYGPLDRGTLGLLDGTRRHGIVAEACQDVAAAQTVGPYGVVHVQLCGACEGFARNLSDGGSADAPRKRGRCTIWQMARCRVAIDANAWARETSSKRRERVARVQLPRSLRRGWRTA